MIFVKSFDRPLEAILDYAAVGVSCQYHQHLFNQEVDLPVVLIGDPAFLVRTLTLTEAAVVQHN